MEIFWNTVARYNAATWSLQILLVVVAVALTVLLYRRPSRVSGMLMKGYLVVLNAWIALVYYHIYCAERSYGYIPAFLWGIMALIWAYDLLTGYTVFERTRRHGKFILALYFLPFVYPLFSLLRGLHFPAITTPVMPCCVAVFTLGLLLAFSKRVNLFIVLVICHWALLGLSKVYFYSLAEDLLLTSSIVPALYFLLREYADTHLGPRTKPTARTVHVLLAILCGVFGVFFIAALVHGLCETGV